MECLTTAYYHNVNSKTPHQLHTSDPLFTELLTRDQHMHACIVEDMDAAMLGERLNTECVTSL